MGALAYKYLIMVDPYDNHNKFYEMKQTSNDTWEACYGRVGAAGLKKRYKMDKFFKLYDEKLAKGYVDKTELKSITESAASEYEPIEDAAIREMIDYLLRCAKEVIKSNYTIKAADVTESMINEAQAVIDRLRGINNLYYANDLLLDLWKILPRRMSDVYMHLLKDINELPEKILEEQNLLNIMAGQVTFASHDIDDIPKKEKLTILEANGIDIRHCTDEENEMIKKFMTSECEDLFDCAYYVSNKFSEKRFNDNCKLRGYAGRDIHFWYHGSRNANIWSILKLGLKKKMAGVVTSGHMFGYGSYFAKRAQKSLNYCSCGVRVRDANKGFLMVYKVAYHKQLDLYDWKDSYSYYDSTKMDRMGYDAVYAHAGIALRNDEIIVYDEAQATIRYLIQLKRK